MSSQVLPQRTYSRTPTKVFLILLTVLLFSSSALSLSDNDLDMIQPTKDTENLKELGGSDADSTGKYYWFEGQISNLNFNDQAELQFKDHLSKSFTSVGQLESGRTSYGNNQRYFFNVSQSLILNEGESKTITIDGNEHTFELVLTDTSTTPETADIVVNGLSDSSNEEGQILDTRPENRYIKIRDVTSSEIELAVYDKILSPEGYNEYRLKYSSYVSDSIFFSVDRGSNIPYDSAVVVDGKNVRNPDKTNFITPNSGVNLNITQKENDDVNITLVDNSDDSEIQTISTGAGDEGVVKIYNDVKNELIGSFTDTTSKESFKFTTEDSTLLADQSTNYNFYFKIKDLSDKVTRTTKVYSVQTSGSATNPAPQINELEAYDGSTWKSIDSFGFGEEMKEIRVKVNDSNNDRLDVALKLEDVYDGNPRVSGGQENGGAYYDRKSGEYYYWNNSIVNKVVDDSGGWKADVFASDGDKNSTKIVEWSYPFSDPEIEITYPQNSILLQQYEVSDLNISVSCASTGECVNDNETIDVYADPQPVLGGVFE